MMWAADFNESMDCNTENCPELLVVRIPKESVEETREEINESDGSSSRSTSQQKHGSTNRSISVNHHGIKVGSVIYPFCGLTKGFWSKHEHFQICTQVSSTKMEMMKVLP